LIFDIVGNVIQVANPSTLVALIELAKSVFPKHMSGPSSAPAKYEKFLRIVQSGAEEERPNYFQDVVCKYAPCFLSLSFIS
jgi:hypothetical protein